MKTILAIIGAWAVLLVFVFFLAGLALNKKGKQ